MENEVEIKLEVTEKQFERVKKFLADGGQPPLTEEHQDVYFTRAGAFLDEQYPFEWLSVRQRNDAAKLSYKHFFPERAETHTHCHELEVGVTSATAAARLLTNLGFREMVTVKKTRATFVYKDTLVSLDRVDNLGTFIEVEASERVDLAKATQAVNAALQDLDLTLATRDLRGYPFRLLQRGERGS